MSKILYVEDNEDNVYMLSRRLKRKGFEIVVATDGEMGVQMAESEKPDLIIVDSIQTVYSEHLDNAPGSISQVRSSVMELTSFAKSCGVAAILVGHVTKEGQIAGPRLVEHMVDTVLYFEGEKSIHYRILRSVKNRFGASDEIGVFEMTGLGLQQVENPSALFLGERNSNSAGSVVLAAIEGTRPVLVEIQALVATSSLATARRAAVGWEPARLAMVMAILESRCGKSFIGKDVYLNVAGGMKISEPAADLAVAAALMSAVEEIELSVDYTNSLHSIALKIIERNRKLFKKQVFIESNEKSVTERIKFVKWYVATHDAPLDELLYDLSEFYLHISYDRLIRMLKDQNVIKDVDKC